ncbi:MAG: site-specific DNA-methyltransferase [Candidatus Woesearchaeota archaeon]
MSNIYEQRFFSALKDTFIGYPIKGKSGYVNLMDMKAKYFNEIEPFIRNEIDEKIESNHREELFEKLYNFFDCYLNETGTVFFANSQIHKNLYEKVYSDRDDVALFWKTQRLYYVKSEANYDDLETELNGINIVFDASEIKHAKGNEKKALQFYLAKATKEEVIFKIRYQENNQYDRLKEYLDINKNNDIIDKCLDEYDSNLHPHVVFEKTELDHSVIHRKGDQRKCLYIENLDDALNSVKVEYSISDFNLMLQYLHKKGIILYEEDLKKLFSLYKRQNEVDYFIHKDAEGFLKEQLDIYLYNWLFNDIETDFDAATVKRMQNIKIIAHKVIEYIARFEDELKAIWEKPKFVRNCNYVLTLDKLSDNIELIEKIINSPGWDKQVEEWQNLNKEWQDREGNKTKKEWKEFVFANKEGFEKNIITNGKLNTDYQYLPIDTKFFPELKYQILSCFDNLDNESDGTLIKTDNWQGLNTIKEKYNQSIDLIYIDPPFNTGTDFLYKDKFQNSTWLSIIHDRVKLSRQFLKRKGNFLLHLDYNSNHLGRIVLDNVFGEDNFRSEISYKRTQGHQLATGLDVIVDNIFWFANSKDSIYHQQYGPVKGEELDEKFPYIEKETGRRFNHQKLEKSSNAYNKGESRIIQGKKVTTNVGWIWTQETIEEKTKENPYVIYWTKNGRPRYKEYADEYLGRKIGNLWDDLKLIASNSGEAMNFMTQKPEALIERILKQNTDNDGIIMDYFSGSATTIATSHKYQKKWIGMEMGNHFEKKNIPRMKKVLAGDKSGVTNNVNWRGGGFFKYYELEQYEDVLLRAKYQWQGKEDENQVEKYSFMQDEKLLDAIEIDYENKNAKIVFENLYPDVDIAETLSNLSGKPIKQRYEDKVIFDDDTEIKYDEMTFEKYPWIKSLIWWNSK